MNAKKKNAKKDSKRFERHLPPGPLRAALAQAPHPTNAETCEKIEDLVNNLIREACAKKEFEQTSGNCASGGSATAQVDLVVLIDTSFSMSDEATELSNAAAAAIAAAQQ